MSPYDQSVLRLLSDIDSQLRKINSDIIDINDNIKDLKKEHETFMSAFPNGIEDHKRDHKKKKWWIL